MKPRHLLAQAESCTGSPLDLIDHDGRYYLECERRQVDASHLGYPARQLITTMSRPFRPARKPTLVFLGLGFGHAVLAAREALPQEKASFAIFPECPLLPEWLSEHLEIDPLDDERIHLDSLPPFASLDPKYQGCQAIFADLDHLEALAPQHWSITSPEVLHNYYERLKKGGLLGLLATRPVPDLEKALRKVGFEVALDLAPVAEESKKNRTLYLARKGHYERRS